MGRFSSFGGRYSTMQVTACYAFFRKESGVMVTHKGQKGMKRTALVTARIRRHWTQTQAAVRIGVDMKTLSRWERGSATPRAYHIEKLCEVYGATMYELGLTNESPVSTLSMFRSPMAESAEDASTTIIRQDLTLRFMCILLSWPTHSLHYRELQAQVVQATGEITLMNKEIDQINRREALRRMALLPIEMYGLSALGAVLTSPFEEVLTQCAAGITACWFLRKGKELKLAFHTIASYVPTLQAIMLETHSTRIRKAAAELLVQCMTLQATLARHVEGSNMAIVYAQQAVRYSEQTDSLLMRVLALRTLAADYAFVQQWNAALTTGEKAQFLMQRAELSSPLPPLVSSFVYSGLACYQAHQQQKEAALISLGKAQETFFAQSNEEVFPIWIDHNQANLLNNTGQAQRSLGSHQVALDAWMQTKSISMDDAGRVEVLFHEMMTEVERDDRPRDMEWCVDMWIRGIEQVKQVQSEQHYADAMAAYTALRVAWPTEQRIKDLREYTAHW